MAMIKCSECGKDISDKAEMCIGCGAPISVPTSIFDIDGDGKIDFNDFKTAVGKLKGQASSTFDDAVSMSKRALQSKVKDDECDVDNLCQEFSDLKPIEKTEDQIKCEKFKAALESTLDLKIAELLQVKSDTGKYLAYADAQILTATVNNIFKNTLAFTPPQITAACTLSSAILAPSAKEKQNLIKGAVGLAGGTAGIGMVIGGVGAALGWGASMVAGVTAVFAGSSIAGPVGWVVAGVSLAAVAGYFAVSSNNETNTERFINVLKSSTAKAVDAIWPEHGEELSKSMDDSCSDA